MYTEGAGAENKGQTLLFWLEVLPFTKKLKTDENVLFFCSEKRMPAKTHLKHLSHCSVPAHNLPYCSEIDNHIIASIFSMT